MKREDVTGGKYFKADDLLSGDKTLVIESADMEDFKQEDGYVQAKLVVTFKGTTKKLACGKNKANEMFDLLGDDTDDWEGQRIRLALGKTNFAGKRVNCVDVKAPAAPRAKAAAAAPSDAEDDADPDNRPPF